jgi:hypothetical protein
MNKTYTPAFMAHVVYELLKEPKTIRQHTAEHGTHTAGAQSPRNPLIRFLSGTLAMPDALQTFKTASRSTAYALSRSSP